MRRAGAAGGGEHRALIALAAAEQAKLAPGQYALRGLFAGGTFCYEAQLILKNLPEPVLSNAPLVKANKMPDSHVSRGHVCVDLGEDEFTQGRLHPMIDPSLRNRRILQEARDPAAAVILLDIVLGYGAHPIRPARRWRRSARRSIWQRPQGGIWSSWRRFAGQRVTHSRSVSRRRSCARPVCSCCRTTPLRRGWRG